MILHRVSWSFRIIGLNHLQYGRMRETAGTYDRRYMFLLHPFQPGCRNVVLYFSRFIVNDHMLAIGFVEKIG